VFALRLLAVAAISSGVAVAQQTQTDGRTVWDGVYTPIQAAHGKTLYEASCVSCHREGPRKDDAFMRDWGGSDVEKIFSQIKRSMPPGAPASLSDSGYLDIVAYMLLINGFPAGPEDLGVDAIRGIRIEGRNGPDAVPNFALVRVVGCLARRGDNAQWMLADAPEPVRTRNPAASTDDELKSSEAAAAGEHTFQLLNVYPSPDPYKGHTVEAKGFLIRDPAGDRINVTSLQTLAPLCRKTN
jgi:mono/diheme cytochrome c family protein